MAQEQFSTSYTDDLSLLKYRRTVARGETYPFKSSPLNLIKIHGEEPIGICLPMLNGFNRKRVGHWEISQPFYQVA
jgi:hypothetical protein